jgi:hypothetical protein
MVNAYKLGELILKYRLEDRERWEDKNLNVFFYSEQALIDAGGVAVETESEPKCPCNCHGEYNPHDGVCKDCEWWHKPERESTSKCCDSPIEEAGGFGDGFIHQHCQSCGNLCGVKREPDECPHCHMSKAERNPSGYCDHLYYPDNCEVCKPERKEIKPLNNNQSVKLSSTLAGQRELLREIKNKVNELVTAVNRLSEGK